MDPTHRILWDGPFHDWLAAFHPTGTQCFHLFNWVLDVTEFGPDPSDPAAESNDVRSCAIEDSDVTVFYTAWHNQPVVAIVEILSL